MLPSCISSVILAVALLPAPVQGEITSAAELQSFFGGETPCCSAFSISGTVTYVTANDPAGNFIIRDASGGVNLYLRRPNPYKPGDILRVRGTARIIAHGEHAAASGLSCTVLGQAPTPTNLVVSLAEIDNSRFDLQNVETEGIVADAFTDDLDSNYDFLILKDAADILPVACLHDPSHERLIDARVRVRGLFQRQIYGERKFVGPNILADAGPGIEVLEPPPADPFAFPVLEHSIYTCPRDILRMGKRSTTGLVLATWARQRLVLQTDTNQYVCVQLAGSARLPPCGSRVTVVGYPETDLLRYHLTRARVRVEPGEPSLPSADDQALQIFNATIGNNNLDNKLFGKTITLRGIVRLLPAHETENLQLTLDVGQTKVRVDYSTNPTADEGLAVGSEIEVTGCVILKTSLWHPSNIFPRVEGCSLILRQPSDIRILANPPWWTPRRLAIVIAILLLALGGVYVRNLILTRLGKLRLNERTQLAVELHDSLSQTLAGLACQIGASQDSLTTNPASAASKLETASQILKSCRTELRHCLFDLRNDTIAEKDLGVAVRRTLEPLSGDAEIAIRFNVKRPADLDDATVHAILAIVRELVANAVRHGEAWTVHVAGTVERGQVRFSVGDNGRGFEPDHHPGVATGHFGLAGIAERLKRLNGTITIFSSLGTGTKVVVSIPIKTA